jgi:hypothetical protein
MGKIFRTVAFAVVAFGFAFASGSQAGTEIISDLSSQAPQPAYNYAPPPRPIYYAPPPPQFVVYPRVAYYAPGFGFYRNGHWYGRRAYHHSHNWR